MKLLLTSNGLVSKSIVKAFFDLVGKKPKDTSLVFIPTSSNAEDGDKGWIIDDLVRLKKLNFKSIDIADISSSDKKSWKSKIEKADVLYFEGGDTHYLMTWIKKSGLAFILPKLLKNKVYVGSSAGSMVTGIDLKVKLKLWSHEEDSLRPKNIPCLNLVDFYFLPHFNSSHSHFKFRKEDFIRKITRDMTEKIYVLNDNSALKIVDGKVEVVGKGKYLILN